VGHLERLWKDVNEVYIKRREKGKAFNYSLYSNVLFVMPDLIRHPEGFEKTGFRFLLE